MTDETVVLWKGERWRHRWERWRVVTVTDTSQLGDTVWVHVNRNTSRRKQAIKLSTLTRDYERVT